MLQFWWLFLSFETPCGLNTLKRSALMLRTLSACVGQVCSWAFIWPWGVLSVYDMKFLLSEARSRCVLGLFSWHSNGLITDCRNVVNGLVNACVWSWDDKWAARERVSVIMFIWLDGLHSSSTTHYTLQHLHTCHTGVSTGVSWIFLNCVWSLNVLFSSH